MVVAQRGGIRICHLLEEPETNVMGGSEARTVPLKPEQAPSSFLKDRRPHRRSSSLRRGSCYGTALLTIVSLTDFHFGLLSERPEIVQESYRSSP
jgi:hypothetical protein